MVDNQTAKDIKNAFNAMAGGVKEAGKNQVLKEVEKKGYIAFRKPEAVAMFHSNPDYIDWTCQFVDGEYRFYPPKKAELIKKETIKAEHNPFETAKIEQPKQYTPSERTIIMQSKDIVETYKKAKLDTDTTTFVSVSGMSDQPENVIYRLIATDKKTGHSKILQNLIFNFAGKFSQEILPSIYNQMLNGIPAEEFEKEIEPGRKHLVIRNNEGDQTMGFGNITNEQAEIIKQMKGFVDAQYINMKPEQSSSIKR